MSKTIQNFSFPQTCLSPTFPSSEHVNSPILLAAQDKTLKRFPSLRFLSSSHEQIFRVRFTSTIDQWPLHFPPPSPLLSWFNPTPHLAQTITIASSLVPASTLAFYSLFRSQTFCSKPFNDFQLITSKSLSPYNGSQDPMRSGSPTSSPLTDPGTVSSRHSGCHGGACIWQTSSQLWPFAVVVSSDVSGLKLPLSSSLSPPRLWRAQCYSLPWTLVLQKTTWWIIIIILIRSMSHLHRVLSWLSYIK